MRNTTTTAIPTTEAGRVVAANAHAHRQQQAADARDKARAELAANRADTTEPRAIYRADVTTPLETIGAVPLDTLPDPPARRAPAAESTKPARAVTLTTTINYRDYEVTITATGMLLDEFCDMIDKRLGVVNS